MQKQERNLFRELFIWMTGFGLVAGICFPPTVTLLGVPAETAFSKGFFLAALVAGLLVGLFNFVLARYIIQPRLKLLSERMNSVADNIKEAAYSGLHECDAESCQVPTETSDELGKCAVSFNSLIDALVSAREVEAATSDFTSTLSSHLDITVLTEKALLLLKDHASATAGAVLLEKGGELVSVAQHGFSATDKLCRSDHVREALRALECRRIEFPEDAVIDGLVADLRPREVVVLPVAYKDLVLGAVILAKTQVFSLDDLKLLNLFRQSFGLALHNAVIHDRMQRMAALDPLTGVYNRRFGITRFNEELKRALRTKLPLGIVLYDIDRFKNVNDTYGHLVGDRVLVQVVQASQLALREGDILIRYGGEEFLVIIPGASKENSAQVAERIRRAVADTVIHDGQQSIQVTVSAGVTAFRGENRGDPIDLIRLADSALYTAKENGRDQVVVNWQTDLDVGVGAEA